MLLGLPGGLLRFVTFTRNVTALARRHASAEAQPRAKRRGPRAGRPSVRDVPARGKRAGPEACLRGGPVASEATWRRSGCPSVRNVEASRKRAGPEARLRGGPARERRQAGRASAEVRGAPR